MRKIIIAGNWKMNKNNDEAAQFASELHNNISNISKIEIVLCPPFTAITSLYNTLKDSPAHIGAQNVHWEESGAYTAEISIEMLKNAGCKYVVIGHSERRQYFGETNKTVNKRINRTLITDLTPIVCIGETIKERKAGTMKNVVGSQIKEGLAGLTKKEVSRLVLAYEPVWAIGTGVTATPDQAEEAHGFIRGLISELFNSEVAENIQILYGGSVKPENIEELLTKENIDGGLIGGASLKVNSLIEMINIAEELSN
ncbi:MAG: triose-phosphate isomerase [Nanoarchaeota archaeon]|nr:triose-phosphate isomerase [Nanoarchaeota archaeon]